MKFFLPISFLSSFPVIFLSSSTTLASPFPPPADPQLDFSSVLDFHTSSLPTDLDFLLPQHDRQQPFPLGATTTTTTTTDSNNLPPLLLSADKNNPPTTTTSPTSSSHQCNTPFHLLRPRGSDGDTTTTTTKPDMCPMNMEEIPYPAQDWDQAWADYLRKYPPRDGTQVRPEEEGEEEKSPVMRDESVGTGCPDPFHQDHLCCAGPAGKTGLFSSRPYDVSYIQHCMICMWEVFLFFSFL